MSAVDKRGVILYHRNQICKTGFNGIQGEHEVYMETILTVAALVVLLLLIYGCASQYFLKTEYYTITSSRLKEDRVAVLLTDLHACRHGKPGGGEENGRLLARVERESPDLICIAGDMTVKSGKRTEEVLRFVKRLTEIAPVYYAPGNHEIRMPEYEEFRENLRKSGVHYLEDETMPQGEDLRITGLSLEEYWYHKFWQRRRLTGEELLEHVTPPEERCFSLLLAHNPEYFPQYAEWGADLVFSGHIHGGIARLPLLGGVISPSLRLFPRYDAGEFEIGEKHMIVSRGLGLHHIRLRFFNRPEVSVIRLAARRGRR